MSPTLAKVEIVGLGKQSAACLKIIKSPKVAREQLLKLAICPAAQGLALKPTESPDGRLDVLQILFFNFRSRIFVLPFLFYGFGAANPACLRRLSVAVKMAEKIKIAPAMVPTKADKRIG